MSEILVAAKFQTTLASGITASSTTATLVSNVTGDNDSSTLPNGNYGFVIDENNSSREYVIAAISGTGLTFTKRGLAFYDGDTEKPSNKKAHRKGASIKIVDHPVLARIIGTLNGAITTTTNIKSSTAPSTSNEYTNKAYVDGVAISGGADASTTVKGISKLSYAPTSPTNPIAVGDNDPRIPTQSENDALAGLGGSPTSTNLYLTELGLAGVVLPYAGSSAPTGFLLCDGSAVSRTTYSRLFTIISTQYGVGDGSTTFNLPDLKGRIPVGKDGGQTEFDVLGETGGAKTHTLTVNEMPSHSHDFYYNNGAAGGTNYGQKVNPNNTPTTDTTSIGSKGGGLAHNNLQPYITLNYIIKY